MVKTKQEIRKDLIEKARKLLETKGSDFLTARKLADYSGYSVGTIYNQFKSMDNLILLENCQTLDELYEELEKTDFCSDAYKNLNLLLERFVDFVLNKKILWFTLYNFHFANTVDKYEIFYLRRIVGILKLLEDNIHKLFTRISEKERKISTEVLFVTLFTLSSLLTTPKEFIRLEKKYVVYVLFNTYLAGVSFLEKG